ncbi:MAG: hypothetical protein ONB31_15065 [candidate division KSB1 bacterium]|nr:hypothetical protein [candidate division KSB1 bacterium]MDZ7339728.1 hypothetical protein [candidate division KSB1 bacterium]
MRSTQLFVEPALPGLDVYDGYQVIQERRTTDQRLRKFLNEKLDRLEKQFARFGFQLRQHGSHNSFELFDRIVLSLKMLSQSLIDPAYNSGPFFKKNVNPAKLHQIVEYDQHLASQIDVLLDEAQHLEQMADDEEIEEVLNHLYDLIDGVNQTWSEREFLILDEN